MPVVSVVTVTAPVARLSRSILPLVESAVSAVPVRSSAPVVPMPVTALRSMTAAVTSAVSSAVSSSIEPAALMVTMSPAAVTLLTETLPLVVVVSVTFLPKPPAVTTSCASRLPASVVRLMDPSVVETPVTPRKQVLAAMVPTVKPSASANSMTPAAVDVAANVPETALVSVFRTMLPDALAPRFVAMIVPLPDWVMLPVVTCSRTVPLALIAEAMSRLPVPMHSSMSVTPLIPLTPGVKQPDALTVPMVNPSLSWKASAPVVAAANVSTSLAAESRSMPPEPARIPSDPAVMAPPV